MLYISSVVKCSALKVCFSERERCPKMLERKKRSRFEVASEILKLCRSPQGVWMLIRVVNMSYGQAREAIDYLVFRGFLEVQNGAYTTTDFGNEFLAGLNTLFQIWGGVYVGAGLCRLESPSLSD